MPRLKLNIDDVRQLPLTHEATIPEDYLDAMGHMNVMWYTHLFSEAMGGMFQLVGLDWEHLEAFGAGTFALEAHIRYLSEVRVGQRVEVHSRLVGRSEKRFHAIHFMVNLEKEDVSSTFESVGAYIDLNARRMAEFPAEIAASIDEQIEQHATLSWPAPLSGIMQP
jgi:acyl-CoA thioester hydrolase